jgi:hypothetical protein
MQVGVAENSRLIRPPFDADDLRPPGPELQSLQIDCVPDEESLARLSDWFRTHPDVQFSFGSHAASVDPSFLDAVSSSRAVSLTLHGRGVDVASYLERLPDGLRELRIAAPASKLDLSPLARLRSLTALSIEGSAKNLEIVGRLTKLEYLSLRSVRLENLETLRPLENLRSLGIGFGGAANLEPIAEIGRIEDLQLARVKGLANAEPIATMPHLRRLSLAALRGLDTLPDLSFATELEVVWLENMKSLNDLSPLGSAPTLREVHAIGMSHLRWPAIASLVDHPKLELLRCELGTRRADDDLEAQFDASLKARRHGADRLRLVTGSTTNMKRFSPSRKAARAGDVFELLMPDGLHSFGRVIDTKANAFGDTEGHDLLVYFFRGRFATATPTREVVKLSELLMPPIITDRAGWATGCFRTVAHWDFSDDERLPVHAFAVLGHGGPVDEHGNELPPQTRPNADRSFSPYRAIDDKLSELFGVPPVPGL